MFPVRVNVGAVVLAQIEAVPEAIETVPATDVGLTFTVIGTLKVSGVQ